MGSRLDPKLDILIAPEQKIPTNSFPIKKYLLINNHDLQLKSTLLIWYSI